MRKLPLRSGITSQESYSLKDALHEQQLVGEVKAYQDNDVISWLKDLKITVENEKSHTFIRRAAVKNH